MTGTVRADPFYQAGVLSLAFTAYPSVTLPEPAIEDSVPVIDTADSVQDTESPEQSPPSFVTSEVQEELIVEA